MKRGLGVSSALTPLEPGFYAWQAAWGYWVDAWSTCSPDGFWRGTTPGRTCSSEKDGIYAHAQQPARV
jgi:hypothetical protein